MVFQEKLCERVLNLLSILELAKNLPSTSFLLEKCLGQFEAEENMWFSHE